MAILWILILLWTMLCVKFRSYLFILHIQIRLIVKTKCPKNGRIYPQSIVHTEKWDIDEKTYEVAAVDESTGRNIAVRGWGRVWGQDRGRVQTCRRRDGGGVRRAVGSGAAWTTRGSEKHVGMRHRLEENKEIHLSMWINQQLIRFG